MLFTIVLPFIFGFAFEETAPSTVTTGQITPIIRKYGSKDFIDVFETNSTVPSTHDTQLEISRANNEPFQLDLDFKSFAPHSLATVHISTDVDHQLIHLDDQPLSITTGLVRNVTVSYQQELPTKDGFALKYRSNPHVSDIPVVRIYESDNFTGIFASPAPIPASYQGEYVIICAVGCSLDLTLIQVAGDFSLLTDGSLAFNSTGSEAGVIKAYKTGHIANATVLYNQPDPADFGFMLVYTSPAATKGSGVHVLSAVLVIVLAIIVA